MEPGGALSAVRNHKLDRTREAAFWVSGIFEREPGVTVLVFLWAFTGLCLGHSGGLLDTGNPS